MNTVIRLRLLSYFLVFCLDATQLKNWRKYLDYEIATGGENRAIFLFERCVIACAQYEEFWLKVRVSSLF